MQLRDCHLRYVLDEGASQQCGNLLRDCPELMAFEPEVLRLPATNFWLEWFAEDDHACMSARKLGCLVRAAEDGRSGTILAYYTANEGQAQRLPGVIDFDLDGVAPRSMRGSRNVTHRLFPHLEPVLSHAVLSMDPGWIKNVAKAGEATIVNRMTQEAEGCWFYLPFLLTFSVLLSSPNVLRERFSAKTCEPARGGRQSNLARDHIKISLHLGEYAAPEESVKTGAHDRREAPRLHVVRGHFVSRGSKTFWRNSHLRGAGQSIELSKIVSVKAARSARS